MPETARYTGLCCLCGAQVPLHKESVGNDGELYCAGCTPIEAPTREAKSLVFNQEPEFPRLIK